MPAKHSGCSQSQEIMTVLSSLSSVGQRFELQVHHISGENLCKSAEKLRYECCPKSMCVAVSTLISGSVRGALTSFSFHSN